MSRIGKLPIPLGKNVEFKVSPQNIVSVKGPKGTLEVSVNPEITVAVENNQVLVKRSSDDRKYRAMHGLYRALISNAVKGVSEGFTKTLEIIGVGYRANMNGDILELALGYSHPFYFVAPAGISIEVDVKSSKNPRILITGINKELVGQVAAKIRSLRPPEPYKGKGVRYVDEKVRRKAGKSAGR